MEDIPRFIDQKIQPHLYAVLRVLGNERPSAPLNFIAECFETGTIPTMQQEARSWDESLMSYLLSHDVVRKVEQAISQCAVCRASVHNPLEYVGRLLKEPTSLDGSRPPQLDVSEPPDTGDSPVSSGAPPPTSPVPPPEGIPGTEGPIRTGSGRLLHSKAGLPKPIRRSLSYDIISRGGHHRMYRVVKPAVLRAGPDLASKRVERLRAGEMLRILESRENSEGVSRVRCSRGWLSLTDASGNPLIEEERESEGVQFPFKVRRPSELLQQCDPWSDAVSEVQPGTLDARTLRISDGGHTFVETGNGWLCVQGWEGVKSLVPDWHPAASVNPEPELQEGGHAPGETLSSTLSLELAEGTDESGSAAAASSAGASPAGSGGTPGKMQKARRLQAGGNTPGRRTSLTSRLSGKTATRSMGGGGDGGGGGVGAADLNRGRSKTGKVMGANSGWRRNMSLFASPDQQQTPAEASADRVVGGHQMGMPLSPMPTSRSPSPRQGQGQAPDSVEMSPHVLPHSNQIDMMRSALEEVDGSADSIWSYGARPG